MVLYKNSNQEVYVLKNYNFAFLSLMLVFSCLTFFSAVPNISLAAPNFQMPFSCDQSWHGQTRKNHNPKLSIDFSLSNGKGSGKTVVASASGEVTKIGNLGNKSYGKYIFINHGRGWVTVYAHLSKITVKRGEPVQAGQQIGNVGSTGNSTGPHLHFEQRKNGITQPIYFGTSKVSYYSTKIYKSLNKCSSKYHTGIIKANSGKLAVHEKPQSSSKVVQRLENKKKVTIYCQVKGSSVKGPYGKSKLWNKIGKDKYVPDSYVYTGSDGQIAPTCR